MLPLTHQKATVPSEGQDVFLAKATPVITVHKAPPISAFLPSLPHLLPEESIWYSVALEGDHYFSSKLDSQARAWCPGDKLTDSMLSANSREAHRCERPGSISLLRNTSGGAERQR